MINYEFYPKRLLKDKLSVVPASMSAGSPSPFPLMREYPFLSHLCFSVFSLFAHRDSQWTFLSLLFLHYPPTDFLEFPSLHRHLSCVCTSLYNTTRYYPAVQQDLFRLRQHSLSWITHLHSYFRVDDFFYSISIFSHVSSSLLRDVYRYVLHSLLLEKKKSSCVKQDDGVSVRLSSFSSFFPLDPTDCMETGEGYCRISCVRERLRRKEKKDFMEPPCIRDDSRMLVGSLLAFDRHMNVVLADAEEFRKIKIRHKLPDGKHQTEEKEIKRSVGLMMIRGDNLLTLTAEAPPPAKPKATSGPVAPGGPTSGAGRGVPVGRGVSLVAPMGGGAPPPGMAAAPMGLAGPVRGVGGPAPQQMMGGPPPSLLQAPPNAAPGLMGGAPGGGPGGRGAGGMGGMPPPGMMGPPPMGGLRPPPMGGMPPQ